MNSVDLGHGRMKRYPEGASTISLLHFEISVVGSRTSQPLSLGFLYDVTP
jgi:hypothetical protein